MGSATNKKFTGLVAATFTPLTPEGEINLPQIEPYINYLTTKQGVNTVFVNGTTGESMSLTVDERKRLAKEWCAKAKGKMQVILHVGCTSLKDTQELARDAVENQADAIAVISPSFFKPRTADALRTYLREVAAVAPSLPFYYYHIPGITGVNVPASDVIKDTDIPNFGGVKFSATDLTDLGQCISHSQPSWSFLYGVDEQLLAGLVMGVHGAVGSTYNYMGSHMNKLITAFEAGDLSNARTIQFKMQEVLTFAIKLVGFDVAVNKQLMNEISGLSLGPPRPPLMPCPAGHAEAIARKLLTVFPNQ